MSQTTTNIIIVFALGVTLLSVISMYVATRKMRKVLKDLAQKQRAADERRLRLNGRTVVYAIPDPATGDICYVGMSSKLPHIRMKEHIDEARGIMPFHLFIRQRISEGYTWDPSTAQLLETCDTRTQAYEREQDWITRGALEYKWPLLNTSRRK